ncbi:MAG: helix-turn-helix domain-containing protein [Actinomycetia bacterium]|nr:helix-turn-helix domain-containing protein [Actinomycetes bacterium]
MPRRIPPYAPVVRYLRLQAGLSPQELAGRLGVPEYYVGYLEEGYRWPRPPMLRALAETFGWMPFELALVADVEIPYPDWPKTTDLDAWRRLAREWTGVLDAITRYTLARELAAHPDWQAQLDPALPEATAVFGVVACYDWLRRRWTPYEPHPTRLSPPQSAAAVLEALAAGAAGAPVVVEPDFLAGLSPEDRRTVETVARSLKARR